jgi:general secretion pathway protein L
MTLLAVKQTAPGYYRWRAFSSRGEWRGPAQSGDLPTLISSCHDADICLLLDSSVVVSRQVMVKAGEQKHLARLLPFELEPDLACDLALIHVALGPVQPTQVGVAYGERSWLRQQIQTLEAAGLEVSRCVAEASCLSAPPQGWVVSIDRHQTDSVLLRWPGGATRCHAELVPLLLQSMAGPPDMIWPTELTVYGADDDNTNRLAGQLASMLSQAAAHAVPFRTQKISDDWDALNPLHPNAVNLRQGDLAAPVRWQKLWRPLRMPVYASAAACLVFVLSAVIEIQLNQRRFENLQTEIEQTYRRAVPQGVLVDAEVQLTTQLAQLRRNSGQGQLLPLLDELAPVLLQAASVRVHRLTYSSGQRELQLTISGDSNTTLLALDEQLNQAGIRAQTRNISRAGDRQQASLIVSGGAR